MNLTQQEKQNVLAEATVQKIRDRITSNMVVNPTQLTLFLIEMEAELRAAAFPLERFLLMEQNIRGLMQDLEVMSKLIKVKKS